MIPNFINTTLDVLALGLFDLLAPLALKVAEVEGRIHDAERKLINDYFLKEWGYDPKFVAEGINYTESKLNEFSISELPQTLVEFTGGNPDCNFRKMSKEILKFLRNIVENGDNIDGREELTIKKIESVFNSAHEFSLKKNLWRGWGLILQKTGKVFSRKKSAK